SPTPAAFKKGDNFPRITKDMLWATSFGAPAEYVIFKDTPYLLYKLTYQAMSRACSGPVSVFSPTPVQGDNERGFGQESSPGKNSVGREEEENSETE
ncbi:hypothetical protein CHS0354_024668, partial [Potamilus streckersoni]